jgi:hypothetical protein
VVDRATVDHLRTEFASCEDGWRIVSARVEKKRKIYRSSSPEFDANMLYAVLSGVVLGEDVTESAAEIVRPFAQGPAPGGLLGQVALHHFIGNRSDQSPRDWLRAGTALHGRTEAAGRDALGGHRASRP